jgi:hypothetical protein
MLRTNHCIGLKKSDSFATGPDLGLCLNKTSTRLG